MGTTDSQQPLHFTNERRGGSPENVFICPRPQSELGSCQDPGIIFAFPTIDPLLFPVSQTTKDHNSHNYIAGPTASREKGNKGSSSS